MKEGKEEYPYKCPDKIIWKGNVEKRDNEDGDNHKVHCGRRVITFLSGKGHLSHNPIEGKEKEQSNTDFYKEKDCGHGPPKSGNASEHGKGLYKKSSREKKPENEEIENKQRPQMGEDNLSVPFDPPAENNPEKQ